MTPLKADESLLEYYLRTHKSMTLRQFRRLPSWEKQNVMRCFAYFLRLTSEGTPWSPADIQKGHETGLLVNVLSFVLKLVLLLVAGALIGNALVGGR